MLICHKTSVKASPPAVGLELPHSAALVRRRGRRTRRDEPGAGHARRPEALTAPSVRRRRVYQPRASRPTVSVWSSHEAERPIRQNGLLPNHAFSPLLPYAAAPELTPVATLHYRTSCYDIILRTVGFPTRSGGQKAAFCVGGKSTEMPSGVSRSRWRHDNRSLTAQVARLGLGRLGQARD